MVRMPVSTQRDIDGAVAAAGVVCEVHRRIASELKAGWTLAAIDELVGRTLREHKARSCFHKYRIEHHPPFPSLSCLSVNDCVVHGTHVMSDAPVVAGDLVSVDVGVQLNGWIGDAAWTYAIETADDTAAKLMESGIESLRRGVAAMQAGRPLMDWARAVQTCVEDEYGFHLVRGLGGHGYGRSLHAAPYVSNVVPSHAAEWPDGWSSFKPGMLIAVEPMIAVGTPNTRSERREWPIYTADGSLSVHYEADVLITEDGPRNLTESMFELPSIVG
ncbi:MAG: type I methionyl aminopeptidase [Phycisphaerales bacterium]